MPFRSPLRRFLVSCPPPPFLTPSPSSFFSSSVLLSPPLFLFAIFSCWTRKGTYHISILQKDVLLKKFFIKLFIRHTSSMGLLFVFFYLIFTVGGKKPCIGDHFHSWLKSWLAQTTHTPTPWFNRFAFSHRSIDRIIRDPGNEIDSFFSWVQ